MSDETADSFEVQVGAQTYSVEVKDRRWLIVSRGGVEQWRAFVVVRGDAVAIEPIRPYPQAAAWTPPDATIVEHVTAALRERAAAWGPPMLWNDSDWREVMKYAASDVVSVPGNAPVPGFASEDVARIIAHADGENDGANWVAALELRDGRFAFVEAGCDYTGWG